MKHIRSIGLLLLLTILFTFTMVACDNPNGNTDTTTGTEDSGTLGGSVDTNQGSPDPNEVVITFNGSNYTASKQGVLAVSGNTLTIVEPGRYRLSGTLTNAQICVEVEKTEIVELVFAGINITNKSSAPIYIKSADKIRIELAQGTENVLTDARTYIFPDGGDKPNACLYSSEDLTFEGSGSLTVNANYNNGIGTKNDLKIKSGNITVVAANNALKGNQSVEIKGGTLSLTAMDAIKADSDLEGEGYVEISGGTVDIVASDDGIQAYHKVTVTESAKVTVQAADADVNCNNTYNISLAPGALISK